jgi:endonuclease III
VGIQYPQSFQALREFYGLLASPPADLFQFFMWEIVSKDALIARRDAAWHAIRMIPALTPDAVFRTPAKEMLAALALAGPNAERRMELLRGLVGEFRRARDLLTDKALESRSLLGTARVLERLQEIPEDMRYRALLFGANHHVLPVDADITRVVGRLIGAKITPRTARHSLTAILPRDREAYKTSITYLRHHSRQTCVFADPHCTVCPLATGCASVQGSNPAS